MNFIPFFCEARQMREGAPGMGCALVTTKISHNEMHHRTNQGIFNSIPGWILSGSGSVSLFAFTIFMY
jgi:hypothetical protein